MDGWAPVADTFLRQFGWPGLALLAIVVVVYMALRYSRQVEHTVTLIEGMSAVMTKHGEVMGEIVNAQAAHTEIVRTVASELKGLAATIQVMDRDRSRDLVTLIQAIGRRKS